MRIILIILVLIFVGGSFLYLNTNKTITQKENPQTTPSPIVDLKTVSITASFRIITNSTTRIFTDSKYHNLSENVYIENANPSLIFVKKENIKWSDFFKTLPMSLDKKCLTTGTKQTFCTNETSILTFKINGAIDPDALDKIINQDDYLLVEYKSR